LSGTTQVSRYQKGKTNLDFTKATDSEWEWHKLGHMPYGPRQHLTTQFFTGWSPSCCPTNSIKALKAVNSNNNNDRLTAFDPGQPG